MQPPNWILGKQAPRLMLTLTLVCLLSAPWWLAPGEPGWFLAVNRAGAGWPLAWWTYFSLFGTAWALLGATAPLLVWQPRAFLSWIFAAPFAIAAVRVGKGLIYSPRPPEVLDAGSFSMLGEALGTASMPSGHTLTAFTVATAIVMGFPHAKRRLLAPLFLLATLTGLSRVALGAHWPSDVLVGAGLGLLCGNLGAALANKISASRVRADSWLMRSLAVLVALACYNLIFDLVDFKEALYLQRAIGVMAVLSLLVFAMRSVRATRAS